MLSLDRRQGGDYARTIAHNRKVALMRPTVLKDDSPVSRPSTK